MNINEKTHMKGCPQCNTRVMMDVMECPNCHHKWEWTLEKGFRD
jgi:DNA-directed RNA polymerase subunit RPC12/RpoP